MGNSGVKESKKTSVPLPNSFKHVESLMLKAVRSVKDEIKYFSVETCPAAPE
jgi:hypothetical protein